MRYAFALVLAILVAGSSAQAELKVEKLGDDYYNLGWSGTRLEEILPELYDQLGIQTLGLVTGASKDVSVKDWRAVGGTAAVSVGHFWSRDSRQIGKATVFFPYQLTALHHAQEMVAARLAASLNSAQMDAMAGQGGVPFADLAEEQKSLARYLTGMDAVRGSQFPEPELSKRLAQSSVILSFHPFVSFGYKSEHGTTGSGFYLDSNSERALYQKWAPGQREAGKMTNAAVTTPGADAPGDATELKLAGVYTVADIIKLIARHSDASIAVPKKAREMNVMAYCTLPAAALARACAIALGTSWRSEQGKWVFDLDGAAEMLAFYASDKSASDCLTEYRKVQPKLAALAGSGKCVYIADDEWADQERFSDMLAKKPLLYSDLTTTQEAYLQRAWKSHVTAYKQEGKMPELPLLDMKWDPNLKLYIATDDAVLYSEWLDYE